jgi:hypothetical protein
MEQTLVLIKGDGVRRKLVGEIIRRATGKPIPQVLKEQVAGPLGVEGELFFAVPESEQPRLARLTARVFPRAIRALDRSQPVIEYARLYTPDLAGWFTKFGQVPAYYDANGHYARVMPVFSPTVNQDGTLVARDRGTPQGSAISPLLANLFMHYAFDVWMDREFPGVRFERYCDDVIVHCASEAQARQVRDAIAGRLAEFGLELHPDKTRIVYCKDDDRRGDYPVTSFTFLGYTFRPRRAKNRWGKYFVSFLPAVSREQVVRMQREVCSWHLPRRSDKSLRDLALMVNRVVQGWINDYGAFYKSMLYPLLNYLNRKLIMWATRKYRRLRRRERGAAAWLRAIASREPRLFAHWAFGVRP